MADHFYALIMAGGVGSRLWPLSRQKSPKQVLPLMGEQSMFAMAVERLQPLLMPDDVLVVVGEEQVDLLKAEGTGVPDRNYVIEPAGRGTAPAIALSAIALRRRDPEAIMAVLTADHFIGDAEGFREVSDKPRVTSPRRIIWSRWASRRVRPRRATVTLSAGST